MNAVKKIKNKLANVNPNWYFTVLVAFVFFEYVRPQESYLHFLSPFKFPFMTLVLLAYIFFKNGKKYLKEEIGYKLFIAFWLLVTFSIVYAVNTRATYNASVDLAWIGISFLFPMVVILNNTEKLLNFFNYWVFAQVLVALTVIQHGGTGPGGIVGDENDVACALAMAIPYTFYMYFFPGITKRNKILFLLAGIIIIIAVAVTASRGSMLGLGAAVVMITYLSKNPIRNAVKIVLFVVIFGGLIVSLFPSAYVSDMENMTNPEDSTREERLYSWSVGWQMFLYNPVWGVGAGNYPWANFKYLELSPMWNESQRMLGGRAAHSLYFTVIPELGIIGVILYLSMIKVIYSRCKKIKKIVKKYPSDITAKKLELLTSAFQASLLSFSVSSAFISVLYYPFIWHLLGMVLVTHKVVIEKYITNSNDNGSTLLEPAQAK